VEPPGLFLGRGAHPKTGHIKKRLMPEDITINIGEKSTVPPCPIAGTSRFEYSSPSSTLLNSFVFLQATSGAVSFTTTKSLGSLIGRKASMVASNMSGFRQARLLRVIPPYTSPQKIN